MVMRDVGRLSDLIGAIYDCALDGGRWAPTLERIAEAVGACNGQILSQGSGGTSFAYSWGTTEETRITYASRYMKIDPLRTVSWHFDVDDPLTVARFMSHEELASTQFHKEFLAPLGWHDFLLAVLEKSAEHTSFVGFTRHVDDGLYQEDDIALMRLLAPHIRRAAMLHGIIGPTSLRLRDLSATFNALSTPVLLFDREGRCVETNAAANAFLRGMPGWRRLDGRLNASNPALRMILSSAAAGREALHGDAGGPLSIGLVQPDGRRFAAQLVPLGGGAAEGRAVSAMFIQEVGQLKPLPGEVLVRLYGLTPAETRLLVLLAEGHSVEEAAAILGVAVSTARTHLNRLHGKTGMHRQQDLVRLVLSALP